jgi:hypothetical protein
LVTWTFVLAPLSNLALKVEQEQSEKEKTFANKARVLCICYENKFCFMGLLT